MIQAEVAAFADELRDFRRDIHAHPELSYQEFRTTEKIAERLTAAGLKPRLLEDTGLTVDVGSGPVKCGLRADIDACLLYTSDAADDTR